MDTSQHHNKIVRVSDKEEDGQSPKNQNPTSPTIISLPPSSSSSPSHDFSFTISLQPSSATKSPDTFKHPPSVAIDLSPADDIFFHGHLLPLQLISCPRISPRRATSSDNINRPARGHNHDQKLKKNYSNGNTSNKGNTNTAAGVKERNRPKSFMFRLAKWRKALENGENNDDTKEKKMKKKNKERFDVSRFLKRYMKLIPPLFFRSWGKEKRDIRQQPYSHSGHLNSKLKEKGGRRGGGFSAPASLRTSPTNSGLLFATPMASPSDSTMEELQNAIQAAIAHCKSSISTKEDKCRC